MWVLVQNRGGQRLLRWGLGTRPSSRRWRGHTGCGVKQLSGMEPRPPRVSWIEVSLLLCSQWRGGPSILSLVQRLPLSLREPRVPGPSQCPLPPTVAAALRDASRVHLSIEGSPMRVLPHTGAGRAGKSSAGPRMLRRNQRPRWI